MPSTHGLNALVAEGQVRFRSELVDVLREMGLNTYEAAYGSEVLEIVQAVEIHALVIDADLPDVGGLGAVRIIRTFRKVPPFLLLASEITRALQAEAFDAQAVSVLRNPADIALLSQMLAATLAKCYGGC
ncbi:MAG: response regulator [Planctomycetes bacterium]|nr:response regulator [Planctomycetota bacterium]